MEIVAYKSTYKKAIMDMARKDHEYTVPLELNLVSKRRICLVAKNKGKFKGVIIGAVIDKDSVLFHWWRSKNPSDVATGHALYREFIRFIKGQGFKYIEFYRDNKKKFFRKEII